MMLAITVATNTTNRTNCSGQAQINNRNIQNSPGTQKLNDEYDESYQSPTSRTHSYCDNLYDQLQHSFRKILRKDRHENGNTRTQNLNNALVTTNKVLSIAWKFSVNHAPSHTQHGNSSR